MGQAKAGVWHSPSGIHFRFLSAALGCFNIAFAVWGWWQDWDCHSCLTGEKIEDEEAQACRPFSGAWRQGGP